MKRSFQSALVSVSDSCLVACQHCFRADKGSVVLSLEVLERALSRLRELGVEQICFSGGEPLDHPSLPLLIRKSLQFGIQVSFITGRAKELFNFANSPLISRVKSIGLSFDSDYLLLSGVSTRSLDDALAAASWLSLKTHTYLHGTCFNLSSKEVSNLQQQRGKHRIETTLSPAVLSEHLRKRLGYDAKKYAEQLISDLGHIAKVTGVTKRLSAKFELLATSLTQPIDERCNSSRLYVSASGNLRMCPYDHVGEVSVFAPRQRIYEALRSVKNHPPVVSRGCIGTCGSIQ